MSLKTVLRNYGGAIALFLIIIVVWQLVVVESRSIALTVASPTAIEAYMASHSSLMITNSWVTLYETLVGFSLGSALGIVLAIGITYSALFRSTVYPLVVATQIIPKVAVAPLFLLWFGFGVSSKIAISALICFFPLVINTVVGLNSVEFETIELARSFKASRLSVLKLSIISALPMIFSGLLAGSTLAVVGTVVGEFIGGSQGLGVLVVTGTETGDNPLAFSALILLVVIGIGLFALIKGIERATIPWQYLEKNYH